MTDKYILNGTIPRPCDDLLEWARWFETAERHVAVEDTGNERISTIFLSLDHSFGRDATPVLWETMVFGGPFDQEQDRCSGSWEDAEAMHKRMVKRVKAGKEAGA